MSSRPPSGRRPPPPPPPPPAPEPTTKKLPPGVIVLATLLILLSFACGFGAMVVQADLAQPVASGNVACSTFVVGQGDSANTIADHLQQLHLIRNSLIFKLYLKIKGATLKAQPGSYCLSPSMHLQDIINTLNTPPSAAFVSFTVQDSHRLLQFPADIVGSAVLHDPKAKDDGATGQAALPNFKASDFLNIAITTGTFPGIENFWYVKPWITGKGHALAALEGYLAPNTYYVDPSSDATAIIKTMLTQLGEELCPGPSDALDEYIMDKAQCMANQAIITVPAGVPGAGKTMGVFDALKKYYTSDPVTALQEALIIGSLTEREARSAKHFFLVASDYYDRYKKPIYGTGGTEGYMDADVAEQYWLGTTTNPWPTLAQLPSSSPNNPYNLYLTTGLPPSAIAAPSTFALYGAMFPPDTGYYYFFYSNCDHTNHYYGGTPADYNQFQSDDAASLQQCPS
jgi:UPF0755 protein